MERKKYLIVFVIAIITISLNAQNVSKEIIYNAYISGDMDKWKRHIIEVEKVKRPTFSQKWELIDMYYGYIAWCIGNKHKKEANEYIVKADKLLDVLEKSGNNLSSTKAYKAAIIGYKIGLANYKAPFIGPKGQELAKEAVKQNARNPIALIENGNVLYFAPSIVGGSKTEAIKYYEKALSLMEVDNYYKSKNWRYLNLLTFLYQAYIDEEKTIQAKNIKAKIEMLEPDFQWIKNLDKNQFL
jgi:hypothetical protein